MSTLPPRAIGFEALASGLVGGLMVAHRDNGGALGTVVCVHGTLDRAGSFARIARRLDGADVVAYDRRGYQGSRTTAASGALVDHVDDLLTVIDAMRGDGPVTVLGHSFGGIVALAAAMAAPSAIDNLVIYEPPLPWLASTPPPDRGEPLTDEPGLEVERFFRRMVSNGSWERLSEPDRADRIADGPALIGDLSIVRLETPFTLDAVTTLACPLTVVLGSASALSHHAEAAMRLAAMPNQGHWRTIEGAGHGAHLTHPDHLAAIVAETIMMLGQQHPSGTTTPDSPKETPCAS